MPLTPEQAQLYVDLIDHHIAQAKAPLTKLGSPQGSSSIQDTFCTSFKDAEPLLQQMAGLVAWWPSYGGIAAAILKGLLALGDEIYATGCATTPPQTPPSP